VARNKATRSRWDQAVERVRNSEGGWCRRGKPAQRPPELLSPKGTEPHGRCRRSPAACLAQPLHLGGMRPRGNLRSVLLTRSTTSVAERPGTTPKGSAASSTASAALDNAKHARHLHFGDDAPQFAAKPFARLHAFGRGDNRPLNLGSPSDCE